MNKISKDSVLPQDKVWKAIGLFVALTALFTLPAYYMVIELAKLSYYYAILMWMPALAAFVTCRIMGMSFRDLGWNLGPTKWAVHSYILPIIYISTAYIIAHFAGLLDGIDPDRLEGLMDKFGLAGWSETSALVFLIFVFATVVFLRSTAHALGEEIGWRGFLVPQLMRKFGFLGTSLISGVIWFLWHWPILMLAAYAEKNLTITDVELWSYGLMLIALSFPLTYHRLKSGSLWPATILHAAHNTFVYSIFGNFLHPNSKGDQWVGEFGLLIPLVLVAFAVYYTRKANADGYNHKLGA